MLPLKDIPDVTAETLIPHKRMRLSTFARMAWTLAILIVLSLIWLIATKFDIGRLRGADHFVDEAREAVAKKDWPAALSAIQKVDGKVRGEPRFLRVMADYLIGIRSDPATLAQLLEKLHQVGNDTPEDGIWLASAYLAIGRPVPARAALNRAQATLSDSLPFLDTEVTLLRQEGRTREATRMESIMFSRFANDPRIAIRKSARDLVGTFPELQQAALNRLWEIAESTHEHGLAAIRVLSAYPGLTMQEAARLRDLTAKHQDATLKDNLDIASVLMRMNPSMRVNILKTEIDRHQGSEGIPFQQLIEWLAREKAFEEILHLMPRESLIQSAELFPAIAHDLAERQQWGDLMKLLGKERPIPVSNARAAGWRALAAKNLHPEDMRTARAHLEESISEGIAENDLDALSTAVSLAEQWSMLDLALHATLKLAAPGSRHEASLLESCWKLASQLKNEKYLVEISSRLTKLKPGSLLISKRHEYLLLLRGESIETAGLDTNRGLISTETDLLLSALKAYRLGNLQQAAFDLGKIETLTELTSGQSAIYAGLMAKTRGETERAYRISEGIRAEVLLPDELKFLKMAQ